ncbi:probable protein-tyrosine sulfotransferase 1 at C-terminar half [Coccomyxa sp. Obi]|nr:probable protein-tyrosine sulfotransferase 1 at C-terminar half [Coccomyxa sp. Obi]
MAGSAHTSRFWAWLTFAIALASLGAAQQINQAETMQRLTEQVEAARKALKSDPDNSLYNAQLGTLLQHLDYINPDGGSRIPEAERAYRKAAEAAPDRRVVAGIMANLGALMMGAPGALDRALEYTETAIQAGVEANMRDSDIVGGAYFNRGKILGMLGREEEAQAAYAEAAEVALGVAPGSYAKALASLKQFDSAQIGAMEEAVRFLKLSADGGSQEATEEEDDLDAGATRRRRRGKAAVKSLADLQAEWAWLADMRREDQPWLFFALYRAYESQGNYEKAWQNLLEANRRQRDTYNYDSKEEGRMVQGLRAAFPLSGADPSVARALSGELGLKEPGPIFVVGLPRSGSTLIEQILASHPQVFGAGEDTAFAPLLPLLFSILKGEPSEVQTPADVGALYMAKMQARIPEGRNATHIVDKMLRNAYNMAYIRMTLPDACLIHAVRHPLDVALSCFAQPFEGRGLPWASQLDEITAAVINHHDMMEHWEALLPGRILAVPYEALVADQEGWTRRMLQHCWLPWHDAVLQFHDTQRDVHTASVSQVRQKMYKSSVGKWKKYGDMLQPVREALHSYIKEYEEKYPTELETEAAHEEL